MIIEKSTFSFLQELDQNNSKDWLDTYRPQYQGAKSNFEAFVTELIQAINEFDEIGLVDPKKCMFRINRDMRFVKDGRPYNPYFSAIISPTGKKTSGAYYYLRIQPGNSEVLGGTSCKISSSGLKSLRSAIDEHGEELREIIQAPPFLSSFSTLKGESYKKIPKEFDEHHPQAELLKMKQFFATRFIPDHKISEEGFFDEVIASFHHASPLIKFINQSINLETYE